MTLDWSPLKTELALWRSERLPLPLWWRDDDAVTPTPQLTQLGDLSKELGLPVHLAVIPKCATPELAEVCNGSLNLIPIVHGWAHDNQTLGGGKKAEFGRMRPQTSQELAAAMAKMELLFGTQLFRMFVPPWNRIAPEVTLALPQHGYTALSTFTARAQREPTPDLVQINTHVDPIFWRDGGGLVPPDALIPNITKQLENRRRGTTDAAEPFGFLTHHLVHNTAIWNFSKACLSTLLEGGATPMNLREFRDPLP